MPSVHERWWAITDKGGVWFLQRAAGETEVGILPIESAAASEQTAELAFYDAAKRKVITAATLPKSPVGGPALSPDGHTLLYSQWDYRAYDIEVAENFR